MAEEFQAGICGGNSWLTSSSRHALAAASPCSVGFNDHHMMGSFGCPNDMVDMKSIARPSSCGEIHNNLVSISDADNDDQPSNFVAFDDDQYQDPHDSSLQIIGFGLSSTPLDFNQALLLSSRSTNRSAESNMFPTSMLQEDMGNTNNEDSSCMMINGWKPLMNQDFSIDQLASSNSSSGFPISSFSSSSPLLQSLFGSSDHQVPQPQQSIFNNPFSSNDLLLSPSPSTPTWPPARYSANNCVRPSLSLPKQPQPAGVGGSGLGLQFSSNINTPFWNAPALATSTSNGLFRSSQSQYSPPTSFHEQKPNSHNFTTKDSSNEDVEDSTSSVGKKSGSSMMSTDQPAVFKRARIETPSPLPTFKVRKEKLGDRITALQQLVSPFGKTDTASVLHEAIEYIKFLHDQVSVLSTPYMKNGAPMQHQQGKMKEVTAEGAREDLKSRGLCLVPISSTFPVANETTADFWTPTFGATFR